MNMIASCSNYPPSDPNKIIPDFDAIAQYPNAKQISREEINNGTTWVRRTIKLETKDSKDVVSDLYRAELSKDGWTIVWSDTGDSNVIISDWNNGVHSPGYRIKVTVDQALPNQTTIEVIEVQSGPL